MAEADLVIHRPFVLEQPHGTIRGDLRLPDGPPPRSAVVLVHGFKGFKDWGFFPWLATQLAGRRHAVVSFNMTGSGIGARDPEAFTDLEGFAANTHGREQADLAAVMDAVHGDLLPRRPHRVGLLGHSRGGAAAIVHAGHPEHGARVDALVTWAAIANFDRWTAATRAEWRETGRLYALNGRTGQQMPMDVAMLDDFEENREALDVTAAAARIRAPWLIAHGEDDETVEISDGERLLEAARDARLYRVPRAGHTFGATHPFDGPPPPLTYLWTETRRHLDAHLRPD